MTSSDKLDVDKSIGKENLLHRFMCSGNALYIGHTMGLLLKKIAEQFEFFPRGRVMVLFSTLKNLIEGRQNWFVNSSQDSPNNIEN